MTCTCGYIMLGSERTDQRNLNPDCAEHGYESEWYNSDKQRLRREQYAEQLRDLQLRAKQARQQARDAERG